MTKDQIKHAVREAELDGRLDKLQEAFGIMYRYNLIKGSDMIRLEQILSERRG